MGEQPVPIEDDLERALASMRAGFLSGSDKIAAGVASLEEHLADAPSDERDPVRAAVAQIVTTHARLKAKMGRLPAPSWDRFKVMVSAVKTQQTILDQLGHLVKEHVLPKQLQNLSITPFPAAPASANERAPQSGGSRRADDDAEPRSPPSRARAFSGIAAMIVAGLFLSLVPRDIRLQDLAAKLVGMLSTGVESGPSEVPDVTVGAELPPRLPDAAKRSERRVPPLPDTDRPDSAAAAQPGGKRDAASAVVNEPAAPPASVPVEQFVPVVFTHQDQATVIQALSDLKQQYPNILIGRKGEVQPVDLGKKGIWHRLVFLPAGTRPQATKLCDQLMAQGYDRCWVKTY